MKKILSLIVILALVLSMLAGCGGDKPQDAAPGEEPGAGEVVAEGDADSDDDGDAPEERDAGPEAGGSYALHPSQERLQLPKGFPEHIPFTGDAYNLSIDMDTSLIMLNYRSDEPLDDIMVLYRDFIKEYDSNFFEMSDGSSSVFTAEMPGYSFSVSIITEADSLLALSLGFPEDALLDVILSGETADEAALPGDISGALPSGCPGDIPVAADADIHSGAISDGLHTDGLSVHYTSQQSPGALQDMYINYLKDFSNFSIYSKEVNGVYSNGITATKDSCVIDVRLSPEGGSVKVDIELYNPGYSQGVQ